MSICLGETQGGGGSRALETKVDSFLQPYHALLTKPQAISVLLVGGGMENRNQGETATVVLNERLNP